VLLRAGTTGGRAGTDAERRERVATGSMLLTEDETVVDLSEPADWAVVNAGGWGFYRVMYDPASRRRLLERFERLEAIERFNLISDTWAATLARRTSIEELVDVLSRLGDERDPSVWQAGLAPLDHLHRVLDKHGRAGLAGFLQRLAGPVLQTLGWQPAPDEPERTATLRARLVEALGTYGADKGVRSRAEELHRALRSDPVAVPADLLSPIANVVAWNGRDSDYEEFWRRVRGAPTPQEEVRYLFALPDFPDRKLIHRTLDATLREVRSQNGDRVIAGALANRWVGPDAWRWLTEHWDPVCNRLPDNRHSRMLEGVVHLTSLAEDVGGFLDAHPIPQARQRVAQLLELLEVHRAFASENKAFPATVGGG